MRFSCYILCFILIFSLTCCAPEQSTQPVNPLAAKPVTFIAECTIVCDTLLATAVIKRETPQACTVEFKTPTSLEGLTFTLQQDHIDLSYNSIMFSIKANSVPSGMIVTAIMESLNAAMLDKDIIVVKSGDTVTLNGVIRGADFVLTIKETSGEILQLEIPERNITVDFISFTFKEHVESNEIY